MHRVPYASSIGLIANAIIFDHSKIFQMSSALEGKGQESVLTKIIKQLSKDNPKFADDWSFVSSWKYSIRKYGNVSKLDGPYRLYYE